MTLYVLTCIDKPESLALRMATREAHLAYMKERAGPIRLAGPLLDDKGEMAGSMILYEADEVAEVEAFTRNDPYSVAGLFERVEIRAFRPTLGQLG